MVAFHLIRRDAEGRRPVLNLGGSNHGATINP